MKRLCFLSPNVEHTRQVVDALKANDIPETQIYVIAKEGIAIEELPDAGPEDNDFLPAYERGIAIGGTGGLLAGLIAMVFPAAELVGSILIPIIT